MPLPRHKIYIPFIPLLISTIKIFFFNLNRGKTVELLEKELSRFWNKKNCQTLSSWRLGFYYALRSLNLKKGDEVLLTPLGISDIVNAITLLQLKPVFVEMDPDTHNMDISDLRLKISNKTKVIHITYLSGMVPDLKEITAIAKENSLTIIEDITQNYGATYEGKLVGTLSDIAVGSFSLGKCIASLAGGFVITNNDSFYEKIKSYCDSELKKPKRKFLLKLAYGQLMISITTSKYIFNWIIHTIFLLLSWLSPKKMEEIHQPKYYYKNIHKQSFYENPPLLRDRWPDDIFSHFSDFQAHLALITLRKIEYGVKKRKSLVKTLLANLSKDVKNKFPSSLFDTENCVYFHVPMFMDKNIKRFQYYLLKNGIDAVGYALPINSEEKVFDQFKENLPFTRKIKEETVFLPIHNDYSKNDMELMAKIVNQYFD
jgi:perosamine synthetase